MGGGRQRHGPRTAPTPMSAPCRRSGCPPDRRRRASAGLAAVEARALGRPSANWFW